MRVLGAALLSTAAACGGAEREDDAATKSQSEKQPVPSTTRRRAASADDRYLAAVSLLEVERKPAEARAAFEALAADESASESVRARARLGLARAERLLGDTKSADAHLREVADRPADAPAAAAAARAELSAAAGASTRFATGTVELGEGQFLDLDTGGVFPTADTPLGGRAELSGRGDRLDWIAERKDAPEMEGAMPWLADAPWSRVTTDDGRAAWVQQLPGARPAALRFVVRLSGSGAPLAAPRDPFCTGRDDAIVVRFTADPKYARYRIERRTGFDGAYQTRGDVAAPPFVDTDVTDDGRYGYRITGVAENGDEGIPARVAGTKRSRGVTTGAVDLKGGTREPVWFDFAEEKTGTSGDLKFETSYGGGDEVGFLDARGRIVEARREGEQPRTVYSPVARRDWPRQIGVGDWIVVALRGGGVARARVRPGPSWHVHLDYEVDPDADAFGAGPELTVEERASDSVVHVTAPAGFEVKQVIARDPRANGDEKALAVEDGVAIDPAGGPGSLREYTAVGEDAQGRRSSPALARSNRLVGSPRAGTFDFHYGQGWSFETDSIVDASEADVVFSRCAGGISSITLTAPAGIVSLEDAGCRDGTTPSAERLFEMLLGADASALKLRSEARCDNRTPPSDVAILRTRFGGWAKVAIVARNESKDGWTHYPATLRFTYNPREPRFADSNEPSVDIGGVRLVAGAVPAGSGTPSGPAASTVAGVTAHSADGVINLRGRAIDVNAAMEKTISALGTKKVAVSIAKSPLADILKIVGALGVPVAIDDSAATAGMKEVEISAPKPLPLGDLIQSLADQAGVAWTIDDAGTVRFVPRPK